MKTKATATAAVRVARAIVAPRRRLLHTTSHTQAPGRSPPTSTIASLLTTAPSSDVEIRIYGHIQSIRRQKAKSFAAIADGSSLQPLQCVLTAEQAKGLTNGAALRLTGSMKESRRPEKQRYELEVKGVEVVGDANPATYPLQKQSLADPYLREIPHLRARLPRQALYLRFRSAAIAALSHFFSERGFTQCHTPIITSSDCEGAGEVFSIASSQDVPGDDTASFFREKKYLTVSAQLHLEALAAAIGNVWTLSPTFRAEASDTARHQSEFYMLEAEVNVTDELEGVMTLCEDVIRGLVTQLDRQGVGREVRNGRQSYETDEEVEVRNQMINERWDRLLKEGPWPRLRYTDAVAKLNSLKDEADLIPPTWGDPLSTHHERLLAADGPIFITHYPAAIKPFYMLPSEAKSKKETETETETKPSFSGPRDGDEGNMRTVENFDLLLPSICEVAGGSLREHRLQPLLCSMRSAGLIPPASLTRASSSSDSDSSDAREDDLEEDLGSLKWYVDLRRWGSAPHGGFGIGFDRLLMYLVGEGNVREVVAWPRWVGRCEC